MARLRALSDDVRGQVANRLGEFLSEGELVFGVKNMTPLAIAESFPVALLPDDLANADGLDLRDLLIVGDGMHHQVTRNGEAVGFSLSHESEDHHVLIDQFSDTGEAQVIADTLDLVDQSNVPDDFEAFILDARARHLGAVILVSDKHAPSLVAPFRVPLHQDRLQVGRIYSSDEFLNAINALPEHGGLHPDDDATPTPTPTPRMR